MNQFSRTFACPVNAVCTVAVTCALWAGSTVWIQAQEALGPPAPPDVRLEPTMPGSATPFERLPVYFPPELPPLGVIPQRHYGADNLPPERGVEIGTSAAEAVAGDFVAEFLYPALALRVSESGGYHPVPKGIEQYRVIRDNLVRDLRTVLEQVRAWPDPDREARLRLFAEDQQPALASLEALAEKERAGWSHGGQAWGAPRTGRVHIDDPAAFSPADLSLLVRDVAYFQDGLELWQRELLLEVARDVAADGVPSAIPANPGWLAFTPEPSRILLPKELPEALANEIAGYESLKADVKRGLYDTLVQTDRSLLAVLRARKLRTYLESRADALRELAVRADRLRRELGRRPEVKQQVLPTVSPLSPVMAEQLQAIVADSRTLRRATADAVDAVRRRETRLLITYQVTSSKLEFEVTPRATPQTQVLPVSMTRVVQVENELAEKAREHRRAREVIEVRYQALRNALLGTMNGEPDRVDDVLQNATAVALQRERCEAQQLYYDATLEPGLSPSQRRLLLGAAMVALDLDLPPGVVQSTRK
ncbi:MAG: hypothetical protein JNN01_12420 [Opitutaceae bacterium]|nr:hypothetical protein [Opitutaceae bacterium]